MSEANAKGLATLSRAVEKIVWESQLNSIRALMDSLSVSLEEAMKLLKMPESDKDALRKLIEQ